MHTHLKKARKRFLLASLSMVILLAPASQLVLAQVLYGTLTGSVKDSTGAVVPGATVTVVQTETKDTRTTVTGDAGSYILSTLPTGKYVITITKGGFKAFQATDVGVTLNTEVRVDAQLEIGQASETISVTADQALLQTDRADVHEQLSSESLETLPQPTRTYEGLIGLMPGVAPPIPPTSAGVTNNPMGSMQINANGLSGFGTLVRIDGISSQNPFIQSFSSAVPSIEAIQTVNVVTSTSGADQGMSSGASINVQIKSGTNQLHGSLYLYHIDNLFKAKPYFLPAGSRLTKLIDNDTGGTIGGPILHDKLFFFVSYEGDFLHSGHTNIATVPTLAIRSGDMTGSTTPIYDPATGAANGTGRTAFPGKIIPVGRISPISQKVVALIPQPNIPGAGLANNYYVNTPSYYKLQRIDSKIDYVATSRLHFFGRYSEYPYSSAWPTIFGPILSGQNSNLSENGNIYALSLSGTYIATPNFVIDGLYGFTHLLQKFAPPLSDQKYGQDVLGIPGSNVGALPYAGGFPRFVATGYTGYGVNFPAAVYDDPVYEFASNATWAKGKHAIRFGIDVIRQHMDHNGVTWTGFTFTGGVSSLNGGPASNQFNSFADLLLGLPNSSENAVQPGWATLRTWQINPYVSDQWQATPKLTLGIGTGWEYYPVPTRANRGVEYYDFTSKLYRICGEGPNSINCGIHVQKTLFSPRIGLAYRVTSSDVVRAGYSLDPEQINMYRDGINSYPVSATSRYSGVNSYSAVNPIAQGIPVIPLPTDLSSGVLTLPAGGTFVTSPKNFIRGYAQSYNLTVEHAFNRTWVAQAGYVGSHTIHQHTLYNANYGLIGGGAASQPFFNGTLGTGVTGAETVISPLESMNYNSLQSSLKHRFREGSNLQIAYTWSRWMGLCCDSNGSSQPGIPIPQYYNLNYAVMPGDRTHNLSISGVAMLPFGKGKEFLNNGLASAIAGGWQLNSVVLFYSGTPFSVSASTTSLNAPGSVQMADRVKPHVAIYKAAGGNKPYFDTTAFAPVTTARFGNAGFDSVRGPGFSNADVGLFRSFPLFERLTMQARAEVLNVTNTPHFANPSANVSAGGFGTISATSPGSRLNDERYVRLGVKFLF